MQKHALSEKEKAAEGLLPTMYALYRGSILTQVNVVQFQRNEPQNIFRLYSVKKTATLLRPLA